VIDSGHGGQTKDLDGDEDDGYDEGEQLPSIFVSPSNSDLVIYPLDFETNGHIVDDVRGLVANDISYAF
jgi:hypothetical protein